MYDYISGSISEINPAKVVIDNHGIGYDIQISIQTYDRLRDEKEAKLFIWHLVREDEEALFGFFDKEERRIFTLLIGVSGIGPNIARVMLSSLSADEIKTAVSSGDVGKIKGVKGIGLKTAQKIIIELRDKIAKSAADGEIPGFSGTSLQRSEAVTALITLGFAKQAAEKAIDAILKKEPECSLEQMIRKALKML
ncbi:MAG: Holliday junction branch migration protein RuvA [Alistipes sp.]|nr:Holliday junction branch migration protein RuvA [Candidatus Minthomonas equi]